MPTATELRELDDDELEHRLSEYRRELLNLRFQLATGQLDNVARLGHVRKDIARVLTILRDRDIAVAEGREAGPLVAAAPERPARGTRRRRREAEAEAEAHAADVEGADVEGDTADTADTTSADVTDQSGASADEENL